MSMMNTWTLRCDVAGSGIQSGLYAKVYFNEDFTVWGLPTNGAMPPGDEFLVDVIDIGGGNVAFQCHGTSSGNPNAYASARVGDYNGQVQFQSPNGDWITQISTDEMFQLHATGDGYFAIYSTTYKLYVTINPTQDWHAENCLPFWASTNDVAKAARFTAIGQQRAAVLDVLQTTNNASGMSFQGASIAGMNLTGAILDHCDLSGVAGMENCILDGAHASWATLSGLKLATVSISGTDFSSGKLVGTDFTSVHLWSKPPILNKADLTRAVLPPKLAAPMQYVTLNGVVLNGKSLAGADLTGAHFAGASVGGGDCTGAWMIEAQLDGMPLEGLKLKGANLSGADLSGSTLAGVDLTGATLAGTKFNGVDLTKTTMPVPLTQSTDPAAPTVFANGTLPYAVIGLNWSCLDLRGTEIIGLPTDLTNLNAYGATLSGRSFERFTLNGANFVHATLEKTVFTGARLRDKPQFGSALMPGAVFAYAKLEQTSFAGSVLGGETLAAAAAFDFAYVDNCDFTGANMFGVSFAGATLMGANKLIHAANLQEADFSNAFLLNADFTGAVLVGAKFDGAFMVGCVLHNAVLAPAQSGSVRASLTSACLQAASFQGVDFSGADLTNAAITNTAGSISMQYYDGNGKLTEPFQLPYGAGSFPDASSLSAATLCPNGVLYGTNVDNGLSLAQMMVAANPPTKWSPQGEAETDPRA